MNSCISTTGDWSLRAEEALQGVSHCLFVFLRDEFLRREEEEKNIPFIKC